MPTRATLEQEIADGRLAIAKLDEEIKAIRNYVASNEHAMQGQPEALRAITQESVAKARGNLAQREGELQRIQFTLANNQRILVKMDAVDKKTQEIRHLEQESERINSLLEKSRAELIRLDRELLDMTGPANIPQYNLVASSGQTIALPTDKLEILVGVRDQGEGIYPDVDLGPLGGQGSGASRRHAVIRFMNGQWTVTDLGSTNGTFVNEQPLAPNVPTIIQDGVRVRFGTIATLFRSTVPSNRTMKL